MKKCPFCAEEIQDEAIKCRFCNEIVVGTPNLPQTKVPWYCNPGAIWLSYILFLPISVFWCVPLTWLHPKWTRNTKIITSVIMVIMSVVITQTMLKMMGNIQQYYNSGGIKIF